MKNLFMALLMLGGFEPSHAQYSILLKADVPGTYRHHASGFSIDGKGYLGIGEDNLGNLLTDWWMYDPATDAWTQKNNFPASGRSYCASFSINGKGYIACGNTASVYLKELWEYDPALDSWTQKTDFPGAARRHPCMAVLNGEAYVGCGDGNTGNYNDFYKYNPGTNAWSSVPPFIGTKRHHPVAVALNGKLYVGTGHDLNNVKCKDFFVYDPATDLWSQIADIPGIGRIAPFGLVLNNKMVVGWGADEGATNYNDYFSYDETANTWTSYNFNLGVTLFASVFFEIDGNGYAGSGTYSGYCVNEFYQITDVNSSVSSIENNQDAVILFPNPMKESATIEVTGNQSPVSGDEFILYDVFGREIYRLPFTGHRLVIERGNLTGGIYFYKVTDGAAHFASGKLVVQ